MALSLRERYMAALIKLGEHEVKRTVKFIVLTGQYGGYYYLGKSGSLRFGDTVANSVPVSDIFKKLLLSNDQ